MPRNSSSSSSRPAPPPCAPPAWAEMGINEPPPPLFPDPCQNAIIFFGVRSYLCRFHVLHVKAIMRV
jgi:hypothetical protein